MEALTGDLDYLRPAIVSVGTGLRKSELLRLKVDHVNFSNASKFYAVNGRDVEIPPNWLLVVKSKNKKPRIIPMNSMVRGALSDVIQDASGSELVFSGKIISREQTYVLLHLFIPCCRKMYQLID